MIKRIIILLIILPTTLYGQKTEKITVTKNAISPKEVYYVLKSDKSIKHGNYRKLTSKNIVLINGYYKNGFKDSMWIEFGWDGQTKKSQGSYSQDKKINEWEFYDFNGNIEQKYDFSNNEITYFKQNEKSKDSLFTVFVGSDTIKSKLDRPPLYIGGDAMRIEFLYTNIEYPPIAADKGISGKVEITFTIDSNGKTFNHRITKKIGSGCDEEALRIVKKIPDNWSPGLLNGQKVGVQMILPITFSIEIDGK